MEKENLRKKLEETKAKIKNNSKDAHFADALISDLLSIKGQLVHEPTLAHVTIDDIEEELKSDVFHMAVMKDGSCVYKVYGGYTIICDGRLSSLNNTIREYISYDPSYLSDEEIEERELAMSAIRYVLSAPMFAFSSEALTLKIASSIVEYLVELQNEAENGELSPDSVEDNVDMLDRVSMTEELESSAPQ